MIFWSAHSHKNILFMIVLLSDINVKRICLCTDASCTKYWRDLRWLHLLLQCLYVELNFHITLFSLFFFFLFNSGFTFSTILKTSTPKKGLNLPSFECDFVHRGGEQGMLRVLGCVSVVGHWPSLRAALTYWTNWQHTLDFVGMG